MECSTNMCKEFLFACLDWQQKYLNLEADVKTLALMATGQSENMFLSNNDFINIIAENIVKMRDKQNIKSE